MTTIEPAPTLPTTPPPVWYRSASTEFAPGGGIMPRRPSPKITFPTTGSIV